MYFDIFIKYIARARFQINYLFYKTARSMTLFIDDK